jgi:methyl-accepting chemotaxis protein
MDHVTQQNAALVEESAAAAESLKLQAQQLVQTVALFKLSGDGAQSTHPDVAQASPRLPVDTRPVDSGQSPPSPSATARSTPSKPQNGHGDTGAGDWNSF